VFIFFCQEDRVAKVVPNRIFSLAIHPMSAKKVVAVGGKWGAVGIWDVDDKESERHGVHLFNVRAEQLQLFFQRIQ
jgi:hypothetical protein